MEIQNTIKAGRTVIKWFDEILNSRMQSKIVFYYEAIFWIHTWFAARFSFLAIFVNRQIGLSWGCRSSIAIYGLLWLRCLWIQFHVQINFLPVVRMILMSFFQKRKPRISCKNYHFTLTPWFDGQSTYISSINMKNLDEK